MWAGLYFLVAVSTQPWHNEELPTGNVATGLAEGLAAPIFYYQREIQVPGTIVQGVLLAPLVAWFGSSLLLFKILGAAIAAAGVGIWIAITRRCLGFYPAILLAIWFLIPPTYLGRIQHICWANHMECIFWSGAMLWVFIRKPVPDSFKNVAALGLLAGFASFYSAQNLIVFGAIALTILIAWGLKTGVVRLVWPILPCFLVGYAPSLLLNWRSPGSARYLANTPQPVEAWRQLFQELIPRAAGYGIGIFSLAVVVLTAVAMVAAIWKIVKVKRGSEEHARPENNLSRVLVIWIIAWCILYGFAHFRLNPSNHPFQLLQFRYLAPLMPAAMVLCVYLFSRLPKWLGPLVLVPFLFAGAMDQYPPKVWANFTKRIADRPFLKSYSCMRGDQMMLLVNTRLPLYWQAVSEKSRTTSVNTAMESLSRLQDEWRPYGYERLGYELGARNTADALQNGDNEIQEWSSRLAFGVGRNAAGCPWLTIFGLSYASSPLADSWEMFHKENAHDLARGFGYGVAECILDKPGGVTVNEEEQFSENVSGALEIFGPQLLGDVVYGAARSLGEREAMPARNRGAPVFRFLGIPDTDQMRDSMEQGWKAGHEIYLLNTISESESCRRLYNQPVKPADVWLGSEL